MGLVEEIGAYIQSKSLGTVGTTIFEGIMPETPDACVLVNATGGGAPVHGFGVPGLKYEHPGVQIICRGAVNDEATPKALADDIMEALAQIQAATLSGCLYLFCWPQQSPFRLRQDERRRVLYAFNALFEKVPS